MKNDRLEDEWQKKLGRYKEGEEEQVSRLLFEFRAPRNSKSKIRPSPCPSKLAITGRARVASGGGERFPDGTQAVVKCVGQRYCAKESLGSLKYIARLDRNAGHGDVVGSVQLYNELGQPLSSASAKEMVKAWPYKTTKNHSVHSWHLVFSLPSEDMDRDQFRFRRAVRNTIDASFASKGFSCIWGVHLDKPRSIHAHVILSATGKFARKWRFDKQGDMFDNLRAEFAKYACTESFKVNASRREDRTLLRNKIAWGEEPLRTSRSRAVWRHGSAQPEIRTPNWFKAYGKYVQRQDAKPSIFARTIGRILVQPQIAKQAEHPFVNHFANVYQDPAWSFASFLAMSRENADVYKAGYSLPSGFALWNLKMRPQLFGPLKDDALVEKHIKALLSTLRSIQRQGKAFNKVPERRQVALSEKQVMQNRMVMQRSLIRLANHDEAMNRHETRARKIRQEAARIDQEPLYICRPQTSSRPLGAQHIDAPSRPKPRAEPPPSSSGGQEAKEQPLAPTSQPVPNGVPRKRAMKHKQGREMD